LWVRDDLKILTGVQEGQILFYLFPPATLKEVDRERFRGVQPLFIYSPFPLAGVKVYKVSLREAEPLSIFIPPFPLSKGKGVRGMGLP